MKLLLLTLSLLVAANVAHAADEVTLKLTTAEADVVWKGLRKLPVEEVEVIMAKIRQQVTEQTQPKLPEPGKK